MFGYIYLPSDISSCTYSLYTSPNFTLSFLQAFITVNELQFLFFEPQLYTSREREGQKAVYKSFAKNKDSVPHRW